MKKKHFIFTTVCLLAGCVRGEEWSVLYLFQGYYHFASYICYLINIPYYLLGSSAEVPNMVIVVYGLGILYQVLSTMFIVNTVQAHHIQLSILLFFTDKLAYCNSVLGEIVSEIS